MLDTITEEFFFRIFLFLSRKKRKRVLFQKLSERFILMVSFLVQLLF
jgi:hypothetical protein